MVQKFSSVSLHTVGEGRKVDLISGSKLITLISPYVD